MARSSCRWSLRIAAFAVVAATLGAGASTASAATTASVACATRTTAQKFLKIDGDSHYYYTAPAGTFESGTSGWTLASAAVVSGNEPKAINGSGQVKSLLVSSGGSAASPVFCNQIGESLVRFFYKGSSGARVHLHIDATTSTSSVTSSLDWEMTVPGGGAWAIADGIQMPCVYSSGVENVKLTFTAANGSVQLDDLEIDPWKSV